MAEHEPSRSIPPTRNEGTDGAHWAFRICVALAVGIVVTSWLYIAKTRLLDDWVTVRAEVETVGAHVREVEENTAPARRAVGEVVQPVRRQYQEFIEAARQRQQALDIVTGIMKEEINN